MRVIPKMVRIAIFHQFLDNIGGAEHVTLILSRELNADIYTTNISFDKIIKAGFEDVVKRIHSIGGVPVKAPYRHQIALWRFSKLKLKGKYDQFIISGDWAVSGANHNSPNLWYVHSPCRELWDLNSYVKKNILKFWQKPIFDVWVILNRRLHKFYIKRVERVVCNSINTQKRIKKYLKLDARVIPPPVYLNKFNWKRSKDYWLSVNRLIKHKRVDIQLKAFSKLKTEKLIIVGSYEKDARQFEEYRAYLDSVKTTNVEIRHWVSDKELLDLYSNCIGFIATAKDEDFGMTVIESMAAGKPVIAGNEGGYRETILDGITGELIDDIDEDKLASSILKIKERINSNPLRYRDNCILQAKKFDIFVFVKKIKEEIKRERIPNF